MPKEKAALRKELSSKRDEFLQLSRAADALDNLPEDAQARRGKEREDANEARRKLLAHIQELRKQLAD